MIDGVLNVLQIILAFVIVLGILVFVHELGHFLVAKAFRIGVPVFSLGLGPRLFGFRHRETDYRVSMIPLGGYVRMKGDEADENRSGATDEFLSRPRYQRFLVFVAGATFNIVLAFTLMWGYFWTFGLIETMPVYPLIASVGEGSPAEAAGLREGDRILEIAGQDARDEETYLEQIGLQPGTRQPILIERDGEQLTLELYTGSDETQGLGDPGWKLRLESDEPPTVKRVISGRPAQTGGLRAGDRIVAMDDQAPVSQREIIDRLRASPGLEVRFTVQREGEIVALTLVPRDEGGTGRIGAEILPGGFLHHELSLGQAALESLAWNRKLSKTLFLILRRLVERKISIRAFSGPVEIARFSRDALSGGAESFILALAFISLQLGILNLLPIPVLDGGHILVLGLEGVMRRDLSERVKERVMQVGLVLLLAFFAIIIYLDVEKLISS